MSPAGNAASPWGLMRQSSCIAIKYINRRNSVWQDLLIIGDRKCGRRGIAIVFAFFLLLLLLFFFSFFSGCSKHKHEHMKLGRKVTHSCQPARHNELNYKVPTGMIMGPQIQQWGWGLLSTYLHILDYLCDQLVHKPRCCFLFLPCKTERQPPNQVSQHVYK